MPTLEAMTRFALADQPMSPGDHYTQLQYSISEADHENWTPEDLKPYIDHVIETFGFDRVMYGGDWPVSTLATEYPMWVWTLDQALSPASAPRKAVVARSSKVRDTNSVTGWPASLS